MFENATSYSDLSTLQRCPLLFRFRSIDKIEPKREPRPLKVGTLLHKMMALYYKGESFEQLEAQVDTWKADWDNHQEAIEAWNEAVQLFEGYVKHYADKDDFEVLHVEEEFYVTLDNGMVIRVTPDLIIRDRTTDQVWIVDHKTTSKYSDERREADLQTYLYFEAVKALYPHCAGFMYNQMRKKVPTEPRLVNDRTRVADLNRIDTTFEKLYSFIAEEAPHLFDNDAHKIRLGELRAQNRFYWRDWLPLTSNAAVLEDVNNISKLLKFHVDSGIYPRHFLHNSGYTACERCSYADLCRAEMMGQDTTMLLELNYQPRRGREEDENDD